ncbi:thrombospondin type 3 repeat-containing protein, partial [Gammaproteobacteria bacterium]|nr:thrombospondin type 3 repeat-containing protein [Gammaproteobacteria bacterium]
PDLRIDPDGDGYENQGGLDALPLDPAASKDTDGDGKPDEWNPGKSAADSTSNPKLVLDNDDDNDGVDDIDDAFPLDASESADSDGDGLGDNFDPYPLSTDGDGDGVTDDIDAFPTNASETTDSDGDGAGDNNDNCSGLANATQSDFDGDGQGDACDDDDDNDGLSDSADAFPLDPTEQVDTDGDGIGDNSDVYPEFDIVRGNQFLQTTSTSANITSLHVLNTSDREQSFRALMYDGNGDRVGGTPLIGDPVPPMGRIVLTSEDIEDLFDTEPWTGPVMLQVRGESTFDVMSKLISPSGLVSNTNCVREDRVLNIEGFDSNNMSYIRLISTRNNNNVEVTGTLYDANGNVVGNANSVLVSSLAPNQQVWVNRDDLADLVGAEWNGEALLEVNQINGLKLLNLNYITDEQTFFNFSCFEDSNSGRVYLQTTSTSQNVSATHLVNTSDVAQQLTGTLYGSDGSQVGLANQPLHSGTIPSKGRVIISSEDIESAFNISPWSGPAMLEVSGTESFELMTKLTSPSGLISNTNCVRQDQVHNIGGFDQTDMTYLRFFNIGDTPISNIRGSLYDDAGNVVGAVNPILIDELPAKAHVWLNRNQLSDIIGDTWNGTASLEINNADDNLRLLNLNYINSETFFNFSCYETGQ